MASAASGAHLLRTPAKSKMIWNFPNLLSAFQCQLHPPRNELLMWNWLNELLHPLPTDEYLPFFSATLEKSDKLITADGGTMDVEAMIILFFFFF